jgi:hypothetical protein
VAAAVTTAVVVPPTTPARAAAAAAIPKDISGQDFSEQDLSGRDFTKIIARRTNFANCNLSGSVFVQADLTGAYFEGANVSNASFVDAILDGAVFRNAIAQKTWFSKSILDIGDAENVDLTDSMWPSTYSLFFDLVVLLLCFCFADISRRVLTRSLTHSLTYLVHSCRCRRRRRRRFSGKLRIMICDMPEIRGQNKVTGADSKDSLLCTDINYKS